MSNHYHLLVETPEGNISRFMQSLGIKVAELRKHRRKSVYRTVAAGMLWKYCRQTKRTIAGVIGLGSGVAVGWQLKKLDEVMAKKIDSNLLKIIGRIENVLNTLRRDDTID